MDVMSALRFFADFFQSCTRSNLKERNIDMNDEAKNIQKTTGYLEKRGKLKFMNSWKKYWFVLEGHLLLYYRSKDDYDALSPCRGSITLGPTCVVKPYSAAPIGFQIMTRSSVITLRAENKSEQMKWMHAILFTLNQKQESNMSPTSLNHFRYSTEDILMFVEKTKKESMATGISKPNPTERKLEKNDSTLLDRLQKNGARSYSVGLSVYNQTIDTAKNPPQRNMDLKSKKNYSLAPILISPAKINSNLSKSKTDKVLIADDDFCVCTLDKIDKEAAEKRESLGIKSDNTQCKTRKATSHSIVESNWSMVPREMSKTKESQLSNVAGTETSTKNHVGTKYASDDYFKIRKELIRQFSSEIEKNHAESFSLQLSSAIDRSAIKPTTTSIHQTGKTTSQENISESSGECTEKKMKTTEITHQVSSNDCDESGRGPVLKKLTRQISLLGECYNCDNELYSQWREKGPYLDEPICDHQDEIICHNQYEIIGDNNQDETIYDNDIYNIPTDKLSSSQFEELQCEIEINDESLDEFECDNALYASSNEVCTKRNEICNGLDEIDEKLKKSFNEYDEPKIMSIAPNEEYSEPANVYSEPINEYCEVKELIDACSDTNKLYSEPCEKNVMITDQYEEENELYNIQNEIINEHKSTSIYNEPKDETHDICEETEEIPNEYQKLCIVSQKSASSIEDFTKESTNCQVSTDKQASYKSTSKNEHRRFIFPAPPSEEECDQILKLYAKPYKRPNKSLMLGTDQEKMLIEPADSETKKKNLEYQFENDLYAEANDENARYTSDCDNDIDAEYDRNSSLNKKLSCDNNVDDIEYAEPNFSQEKNERMSLQNQLYNIPNMHDIDNVYENPDALFVYESMKKLTEKQPKKKKRHKSDNCSKSNRGDEFKKSEGFIQKLLKQAHWKHSVKNFRSEELGSHEVADLDKTLVMLNDIQQILEKKKKIIKEMASKSSGCGRMQKSNSIESDTIGVSRLSFRSDSQKSPDLLQGLRDTSSLEDLYVVVHDVLNNDDVNIYAEVDRPDKNLKKSTCLIDETTSDGD